MDPKENEIGEIESIVKKKIAIIRFDGGYGTGIHQLTTYFQTKFLSILNLDIYDQNDTIPIISINLFCYRSFENC